MHIIIFRSFFGSIKPKTGALHRQDLGARIL